jgi:hypothetical protein
MMVFIYVSLTFFLISFRSVFRRVRMNSEKHLLYVSYIHKAPVILHDNLHRVSHKLYAPPNSVICGTSTALIAETH